MIKKVVILFMSILTIVGLVGCSEQKDKLTYVSAMANAIPTLTKAYAGLHDLYTNPLRYSTEEWKTEFRKDKATIEDEYNNIKGLTPLETLKDAHASLLSVLELTIDTNRVIDEQIQKGETIDFKGQLAKLTEMTAGLNQAITNIKDLANIK
jgi:uncharacterized lipoprotein YehR (DUF1307 family)